MDIISNGSPGCDAAFLSEWLSNVAVTFHWQSSMKAKRHFERSSVTRHFPEYRSQHCTAEIASEHSCQLAATDASSSLPARHSGHAVVLQYRLTPAYVWS
jgi:hypothetical protein